MHAGASDSKEKRCDSQQHKAANLASALTVKLRLHLNPDCFVAGRFVAGRAAHLTSVPDW